jgi:hypothetical protein
MRDLATSASGRSGAVKKWGFIAMHAAVAAAFIFLLQRFTLNASLESSLLWALTFAACAAGLAYKQANR